MECVGRGVGGVLWVGVVGRIGWLVSSVWARVRVFPIYSRGTDVSLRTLLPLRPCLLWVCRMGFFGGGLDMGVRCVVYVVVVFNGVFFSGAYLLV